MDEVITNLTFYGIPVLLILTPIILCIIPIILCIILFKKGKIVGGRISLSVVFAEILFALWIVFDLLTEDFGRYLEGRKDIFFTITIIILFALALYLIFSKRKNKAIISLVCALIITSGALTGNEIIKAKNYLSTVTLNESSDYYILDYYNPKYGSLTATLSEESTLKFRNSNSIYIDGATALYPVYSAFAKATGTENVECNKTSEAYRRIVDGEADVIFVAAPSQSQLDYAEENGVELVLTPIGREAFVFFVNSQNEINSLTSQQIRDIYSGKITKWSEVGAVGKIAPEDILAYQRNEGSGSQSALIRFMGDIPLTQPPAEGYFAEMGGIVEDIADYRNLPTAIGFSFRFYTTEMRNNGNIKLLAVDGVEPTRENIENETYPIANYFYAVTRKETDAENKDDIDKFIGWILSPQGQELIEKTGYTAVK